MVAISAACSADMKGVEYTDAKCTKKAETNSYKAPTKEELAKMDGSCQKGDTEGTSAKITCTDADITTEAWVSSDKSEGDANLNVKVEFGKCTKMGETYFILTGATAIKAAAFAVAAFAASQF